MNGMQDEAGIGLRRVQIFREIIRSGSTRRASKSLQITQSAVSQQLKLFEELVGEKLFVRDRRGLIPTTRAIDIYNRIDRYFETLGHIEREILGSFAVARNSLSIAAPHIVCLSMLPKLVADAVIHPDVLINSPAGRDIVGREALKGWLTAFIASFRPRIDLIDHYAAGDRALVTVNLHWKHDGASFFGIEPTGKSGTSIESFLLRLKDGLVTHFDVADHSLDLAIYLHEHGMDMPHAVTPQALIAG